MKKILTTAILSYLRFFAKRALANHQPTVIGITGTAGKSSARYMLYAMLKDHFPTKMISGNSETGIPLGILGMKPETYSKVEWLTMMLKAPFQTHALKGIKYLIVEMGIDDPYPPKNMEYLLTIVKPDIALFLNASAGAVHSMQFEKILPTDGTLSADEKREIKAQAIASEKAKIITQSDCKVGIYNADNAYVVESLSVWNNASNTPLLTFGEKTTADMALVAYDVNLKETTFSVQYIKETLKISLRGYLLQKEFGLTLAATMLAALQTGLSLKEMKQSIEKNFELPKSRASMLKGIHDSVIIDSSYNASRIATEGMLNLLQTLQTNPPTGSKRPIVFLFGDMRELGDESKTEHEKVTEKLIGIVDYLYLVGPQTREHVLPVIQEHEEKFKEIRWFDNSHRAGEYLKDNLPKKAIVLSKGSQNTIFLEEAVKAILAEKKDRSKLCRQDPFWLQQKKKFFHP